MVFGKKFVGLFVVLVLLSVGLISCETSVEGTDNTSKEEAKITFAQSSVNKTVEDSSFINLLTNTGDGVVTYTSSNIKVAIVDAATGTVVLVGSAGTATITATVADSSKCFYKTKTASYTLTVNKMSGTIRFVRNNIEISVNETSFTNAVSKTGDGTVTYTSSDKNVAEVNTETGEVTIKGVAGTATITATVADTNKYAYGTNTDSYTFTVSQSEPGRKEASISYAAIEMEKAIDDAAFTNPLTNTGDGVVTYTSSNINVAIVDAATGTVVLVGSAGTATITATVADSSKCSYETKTVSYTLTVNKLSGTIGFVQNNIEISVNETSFTNAVSKTGDGAVTYTSSDTNVAEVNTETGEVTIKGVAGTATITATVADSSKCSYETKTVSYTLTVTKLSGTIRFARNNIEISVNETSFTNEVSNTGDGTVTYTSSNKNVAEVNAETGKVTIKGVAGTATITATVADTNKYAYGTNTDSYTLTVSQSEPERKEASISWAESAVAKTTLDTKFTNALTNTGDGLVYYTSSETTIAMVDARTGEVTIKGVAGNATITATVKDSEEYLYSVKEISYVLTVSKAAGSISFGNDSVEKEIDDSAFTNSLTKTGDGTVTYSSSDTEVATVNASTGEVTLIAAGSAVITATVEDGSKYTYATKTASYTLTVNKHSGSIRFNNSSVTKTTSTNYFSNELKHTGDSTVTYASNNAEVATVDASTGTVSIKGTGTATITATVTDTAKYTYSEKTASFTLTVNQAAEGGEYQLSFPQYHWYKSTLDAPFVPTFNNNGDGIVEFTSSNPSSATVDPVTGEVTILGGDGTLIEARIKEERSAHYDAGKQWATCYIHINKVDASISYSQTTVNKTTEDGNFTNPLTNTGDGTESYSSSNTDVATVDPATGEITILGIPGSTTITANIADGPKYHYPDQMKMKEDGSNSSYYVPMTATYTLAVRRPASISFAETAISKDTRDSSFTNTLTNTGDGTVKYTSSNATVAEVNSSTGEVRITGGGDATITATVTDNDTYTYSIKTISYLLHVEWAFAPVKDKPDAVGDIVLNNGKAVAAGNVLHPEQRAMAVAVIFYIPDVYDPDDAEAVWNHLPKMLGISLKKSGFTQWCSEEADGLTKPHSGLTLSNGAMTGLKNGALAWEILKDSEDDWNVSGRYPAWEWVNNYASANGLTGNWASGWYLPSMKELDKLGKILKVAPDKEEKTVDIVNRSLSVCGGDKFVDEEHYISCNTVYANGDGKDKWIWHYIIRDNGHYTTYYKATIPSHVGAGVYFGARAVRAFDVD